VGHGRHHTKRDNEQDTAIRAISRAAWRYYHAHVRWSPPAGTQAFYDSWPRVQTGSARGRSTVAAPLPQAAPREHPAAALRVDDFERGDLTSPLDTRWETFTDAALGGKSTAAAAVIDGGANGSRKALRLTGRVTTDFQFGFVGIRLLSIPFSFHFSRCFHHSFGVGPRDYRQQAQRAGDSQHARS
jgi:hypothetical protein